MAPEYLVLNFLLSVGSKDHPLDLIEEAGRQSLRARLPPDENDSDVRRWKGGMVLTADPIRRAGKPMTAGALHLPVAACGGHRGTIALAASLCGDLLDRGLLISANLRREGGGASCLPVTPVAECSHLVVADRREIEEYYADSAQFLSVWDDDYAVGDLHLLTRALEAASGAEFLAAVQEGEWALARAALPGLTRYPLPWPLPDEVPLFRAQPPALLPLSGSLRVDPDSTPTFSCILDEGQHVPGWQIFEIADLARGGPVPHIVFRHLQQANAEKRPLLDVGAVVLALDDYGKAERVAP